ncbi:MAG: hypothetical protein JSR38_04485 [Proteobacteria bacterium]|nr:hypothetical protein [Pseudomonadota bacterium]
MKLIPLGAVALLVGVSSARVASWVACGDGPPAVNVDGALMFDMDDVRRWIRARPVVDGIPRLPDTPGGRVLH